MWFIFCKGGGYFGGRGREFAQGERKGIAEGEAFAEGEREGFREGEAFAEGERKGFREGERREEGREHRREDERHEERREHRREFGGFWSLKGIFNILFLDLKDLLSRSKSVNNEIKTETYEITEIQ